MSVYNIYNSWHTATGISLADATKRMMEVLPPSAYKKVIGVGADLTDIDPAYLTKIANEVFGLCGFGWKFSFEPKDMQVTTAETVTKSGNPRTVYTAVINQFAVHIRYFNENDELMWSEPVISSGGNDSDDFGYAIRGAITNALGAAFAKMNWQLPVYMGKVTHVTADALYKAQQEKRGKAAQPAAEPVTQPVPAAVTQETVPSAVQPEPAAPVTYESPAMVNTEVTYDASAPVTTEMTIDRASAIIIPSGIKSVPASFVGKTMGDAAKDEMFGTALLKYLSQSVTNASGDKFEPSTPEQQEVLLAAQVLLPTISKAKKK